VAHGRPRGCDVARVASHLRVGATEHGLVVVDQASALRTRGLLPRPSRRVIGHGRAANDRICWPHSDRSSAFDATAWTVPERSGVEYATIAPGVPMDRR